MIFDGFVGDEGLFLAFNYYYFFISVEDAAPDGSFDGDVDVISSDDSAIDSSFFE